MIESQYIDKFQRVVDMLRIAGTYTASQVGSTSIYEFVSDVETYLDVDDYVSLTDGLTTVYVRVTAIIDSNTFQGETFSGAVPASGAWKSMAPYSDYGTIKTINRLMMQKNGGEFSYQKYPLIALRLPANIAVSGAIATLSANILIATFTSKTRTPQQRIAETFKPILYPLTSLFLDALKKSGEFTNFTFDYDRIDRMFYGTESGEEHNIANVFDDPLDAVEIRNLELNFLIDEC